MFETSEILTIREASQWASDYLGKTVTTANINYLIKYGKIHQYSEEGNILISREELLNYYNSFSIKREKIFREKLGTDLNWHLSFEQFKEAETTKHVHRLHPYKGKFIPQLVEYFLDSNTDEFKKSIYFSTGDIVLDPFCGSGTTLVQANELGINAVGVDVSAFNALISNCKILDFDCIDIYNECRNITSSLIQFNNDTKIQEFEKELLSKLAEFNNEHFPSGYYKMKIRKGEISEKQYGAEKSAEFLPVFTSIINKYNINIEREENNGFLNYWYIPHIRQEINMAFEKIKLIKNLNTKKIVSLILSRTIRSCRATTHSDLATLIDPVKTTYYCSKHGKICKPLYSILKWWQTYTQDAIKRISEFKKLKTKTLQFCLTGDSRTIDLISEMMPKNPDLAKLIQDKKIAGIFSSPPYLGLIDYHEQHSYSYELFGFKRNDDLEIGPMFRGQGKEAKESYINGISQVLLNSKRFLSDDYNIFLVANDKHNLYPLIAEKSGMKIVQLFKRPVLNRTEKDKTAFSEIIFHLKEI